MVATPGDPDRGIPSDPKNGASVDPKTCRPEGPGAHQLCGMWRDPEFDANQRAVYYARVFENPSCRFSAYYCQNLTGDARPASCDDERVPMQIQERAWTSPIWYEPAS